MRANIASLAAIALLALAGCDSKAPVENAAAPAPAEKPAVAPAKPAAEAKDQMIASKKDALEFEYGWPAKAAAVPELDGWLRGNAEKLRADADREAKSDQASAKKDGYNFNGHSYEENFAVVADTARFLVLQSDGYVYTGGAHGMPINTAIIWDRDTKTRVATRDLLSSSLLAKLGKKRFCAALDKEREERRGEPVKRGDPNEVDGFNSCVDMEKQLVLPVSKDGKTLDTVRVVIGPYEAGPYAEGTYVIDLPIDRVMLTAVKAEYRGAFGVK